MFDVCIDFLLQIRYRGVKLSQYKSMYLKKYQLSPSVESQVNTAAINSALKWHFLGEMGMDNQLLQIYLFFDVF